MLIIISAKERTRIHAMEGAVVVLFVFSLKVRTKFHSECPINITVISFRFLRKMFCTSDESEG